MMIVIVLRVFWQPVTVGQWVLLFIALGAVSWRTMALSSAGR